MSDIRLPPKWIELNLTKTECAVFLPRPNDPTVCQCGKRKIDHPETAIISHKITTWSPRIHTKNVGTDAYGTVIFENEHHPNKAHYVRLSYDTSPELLIQLMTYVWCEDMPNLLISIRGGSSNFDMPPRLGKIFQTGIIKVARNTSAWLVSNGLNCGVAKHLGSALSNEKHIGGVRRGRLTAIGIASWGTIDQMEALVGRNKERTYNLLDQRSKSVHLNPRHSNFFLVDNGTVGKFGVENYLRRRFEKCISTYPINHGCRIPVVVIVLEGGFYTLRQVSDYLHDEPPVPVVIFAGTGLSADLIAFVLRRASSEDDLIEMREKICHRIMHLFHVNCQQCALLFKELRNIYRKKHLITVFYPNTTNEEEFDGVILSSIFRSQHLSPSQQLSLTLVWNRVDIAKAEVFIYGRDWSRESLENAMMEALLSNRLEFVNLLLEHGINMQTFLTASRLEALYSLETIPSKVLRSMLVEFSKAAKKKSGSAEINNGETEIRQTDLTLHDIGIALSHMIGHVYQSSYIHIVAKIHKRQGGSADEQEIRAQTFRQPFDDLFVWALLTKRHEMSKLLWRHGKGALAKALIAIKLNKYMAAEITAAEKSFTSNMAMDFENHAAEWETISVALLDSCYRTNAKLARQLLTMELECWSRQTCLTLAVLAGHHMLLGHPCCQILLADLWMGALNSKSNSTLKIILAILVPPYALCLEYKSTEELQQLPHQEKYHQANNHDLYATIPTQAEDPEICMKSGQHQQNSGHEATTDLAIVAKSAFPQSGDNPQVNTVNESEKGNEQGTDNGHDFQIESQTNNRPELVGTYNTGKFERAYFITREQSVGLWRKLVHFQSAPITNFMRHVLGYFVFLTAFMYVIMYKQTPHSPGWVEWYVIICFVTQFLECIREFIYIDALSFSEKVSIIQNTIWQLGDLIVVTLCLVAVGLRLTGQFEYGMLMLKVSSLYWNARLYKYLGVHRFLGPKLSMMRRMLKPMIHFSVILAIVIITFGIVRKAIINPDKDPTLRELAEAFLEPYMYMYGEVGDLDPLTAHCEKSNATDADDDISTWDKCPPGYWAVPIVFAIYMFATNILIVNVLLSVFDGIYEEIDALAVEVWMFQRFNFVMEFEQKPIFPPPLIIISHAMAVLRCMYKNFLSCLCEEELLLLESQMDDDVHPHIIMGNDHGLKSFLTPEEQTMVFDFEEESFDELTPLLEKDSSASAGIAGSKPVMGGHPATDSTAASRHGGGGDKVAIQQLKVVISELHSQLETQKLKLDKLINIWESDLANPSGKSDGTNKGSKESSSKGNNFFKDIEGGIALYNSNDDNISATSSADDCS